ncbi:nucleotide-binding protein [Streptomyces phaeochromogenes]|nr:nucleotide-binding protein [Streptomyces phaeochromogenes]
MAANLSNEEVADFVRQVGRCNPFQFKASVINPLEAQAIQVRQTDRSTSDMLDAARAARRLVQADDVNAGASEEIRAALMGRDVTDDHISQETQNHPAKPDRSIGVFIVHGHGELALKTVERILTQDFRVNARILKEQAGGGMTLIEKFEQAATEVDYAVVLLTADDFVRNGDEEYWQPRPNVLFELGWFCGRLGRDRVCLLAQRDLRILSDMGGVICHKFTDDVVECTLPLFRELKAVGYID